MLAIFVIVLWIAWLVARTWLRRNDPDGLALITGEPTAEPVSTQSAQPRPLVGRPVVAAPPAVGALTPRSPAAYGEIPAYDRRLGDRRRTRLALQPGSDRRRTDRRVSA